MNDIRELERAIVAAHNAGDETRLRDLQTAYRNFAGVVRVTRGPVNILERSTQPSHDLERSTPSVSVPMGVRLIPEARWELRQIDFGDDREYGGWAFGHVTSTEVVIHALRDAAWDSGNRGERDHVMLSGRFASDMEDRFASLGWVACGGGIPIRAMIPASRWS